MFFLFNLLNIIIIEVNPKLLRILEEKQLWFFIDEIITTILQHYGNNNCGSQRFFSDISRQKVSADSQIWLSSAQGRVLTFIKIINLQSIHRRTQGREGGWNIIILLS